MSTLSTHVLDTAKGCPAKDVPVLLEAQKGEEWTSLGEFLTNDDGRVKDLTGGKGKIAPGVYRLTFNTKKYFQYQNLHCFYPVATIVFEIKAEDEHYHVPLLVSGWSYSTYRGS